MNSNFSDDEKVFTIPQSANAHPKNLEEFVIEEDNQYLKELEGKKNKNASQYFYNKLFKSVRFLSLSILSAGVIIFLALIYPFSKIFSGEWKLRQQIDLLSFEKIEIGFRDIVFKNFYQSGEDLALFFESAGFSVSIRYYSVMIFLGLILGYFLTLNLAKKSHVATTIIDRMLVGLIVFGLIGARLVFVLFNSSSFANNPENIILAIQQGGLSIFGAFIGAGLYLLIYVNRFRFNLWEFLDILAPGVLLGQVIGRFGNFFNYEAYGPATSVYWKMFVPSSVNLTGDFNNSYFHPTFLYEIIPNFILLVVILFYYERLTLKRSGLVFAIYCVGYGIIRFITEFYRLDALQIKIPFELPAIWIYTIESIYVSQVFAVCMFLMGYIVYLKRRRVIFIKKNLEEVRI
jgi:phosphatidylglycerol---prolipoprotein diacylglyceryl transferase